MAAAVALVTSAGTTSTAFAQQQLSQMVGAMCPKFATQLAGKAEMASVLAGLAPELEASLAASSPHE